jgi:L-threonylcarbamoyladenylate synthase
MTAANMEPHSTRVLSASTPADIVVGAALLRSGGVMVVPTDTVYGLAASVLRPEAVQRVFVMKRRPPDSAVPVLLASAADLPILVHHIPAVAWALIEKFWPGALTLALPAKSNVDRTITGGGKTVAVRVPRSPACLQLLQVLGEPIVGTSANRSGDAPFVRGSSAVENLGGEPDAVLLDDEHVLGGAVSTVAEVRDDLIIVHRNGAISLEALRRAAGVRVVPVQALGSLTLPR